MHRTHALLKGVDRALEVPLIPTTEVHPVQTASIHHLSEECGSLGIIFPNTLASLLKVVDL